MYSSICRCAKKTGEKDYKKYFNSTPLPIIGTRHALEQGYRKSKLHKNEEHGHNIEQFFKKSN